MTVGEDEIRAEAARLLTASSFQRSERLGRFLRFVVDSALEGKHAQLKEYVLGVEVYQKGADFDPRIDSTVRVEAARLRAKLREYYETEGRDNPIRIELPKGGYAPLFRRAEPRAPQRRFTTAGLLGIAAVGVAAVVVVVLATRTRWQPAAATKVRPLTTWPGQEIHPRFSPDGKEVAVVWSGEQDNNRDIYVKPIGEGPRRRLTSAPDPDRDPVWSPDGTQIAFVRDSQASAEVYIVPALGGPERLIAKLRRPPMPPTGPVSRILDWIPGTQAIAVSDIDSTGGALSIVRIDVETGERRRFTSPPPLSPGDTQPALSPDGRTLAFTRSPALGVSDIYVMAASGGEPRRLTFDNQVIPGIAWTEEGQSIVFSSERGATAGAGSLWRIPLGRSAQPEQVPGVGPRASHPAVARRGRLLAYQEWFQDLNLWRAPAGGDGAPQMVDSSTREEALPDYSPDGRRIVFNSNRSGNVEIWLANADGSDSRQLTAFGGAPARAARWSPDGRLIAFEYNGPGNDDIYTMTPEGESIRRLTSEPSREVRPSWSKDGRWLYFSSNRTGDFEIWKMAPDQSSSAVQLTHRRGSSPLESPDGKYLYFRKGPRSATEIWRMPASGGTETRVLGPLAMAASWAPDSGGVYFFEPAGRIDYYSFGASHATPIVLLGRNALAVGGLDISPDGRWLLYGRRDRAVSDIMLVENFR